jgi:hypothetical protein
MLLSALKQGQTNMPNSEPLSCSKSHTKNCTTQQHHQSHIHPRSGVQQLNHQRSAGKTMPAPSPNHQQTITNNAGDQAPPAGPSEQQQHNNNNNNNNNNLGVRGVLPLTPPIEDLPCPHLPLRSWVTRAFTAAFWPVAPH